MCSVPDQPCTHASATPTQAMDQRYNALADAHGRMASENQRLANENTSLQEVRSAHHRCRSCRQPLDSQELGQAKATIHKLKSAVVEKDAAVERAAVEVCGLLVWHYNTLFVRVCTWRGHPGAPCRSTLCEQTTGRWTRCCSRSRASWMHSTIASKPTWCDALARLSRLALPCRLPSSPPLMTGQGCFIDRCQNRIGSQSTRRRTRP